MSDRFATQYRRVDGVWITFPLGANYQALGGGFMPPQYKRVGNTVYLRGSITRNTSTAAAGSTCGTLPSGYRPTGGQLIFEQYLSGVRVRVDVTTAGAVVHIDVALTVGGSLSLDGISFDID